MMDLPRGWVTGVPGLSRGAQLKAIGNGVVRAQARVAVADLLGGIVQRLAELEPPSKMLSTPRASDGGWEGEPGTGKGRRASSSGWGLRNETRRIAAASGLSPEDEDDGDD